MDRLGGYYAKVRERQITIDITCLWNLKNELVNITKRKHGYREQTSGYQGVRQDRNKGIKRYKLKI